MPIKTLKLLFVLGCFSALAACGGGGGGGGSSTDFTVTVSTGTGGSANSSSFTVQENNTISVTLTPDTAYSIDSVSGCGGSLTGDTFTTAAITADCTINASFTAIVARWDDPSATWGNVVWQ